MFHNIALTCGSQCATTFVGKFCIMSQRKVELLVISDVHLGTYGCRAKELLKYLKSVEPSRLVLNGDIFDIWQFKKRYWPKSHMLVVKHIVDLIAKGVKVDYITGNHDELLRKFSGFEMGSFSVKNKLLLNMHGETIWIFHGDVFDLTMRYSKWLCKLGAVGYDGLILLNSLVNGLLAKMGKGKISLSKKVKNSVKSAVKFISDFEETAAKIGISNGYHNVVCGHIHQPNDVHYQDGQGEIRYLNSGDWIENCTALEYNQGAWKLYEYDKDDLTRKTDYKEYQNIDFSTSELFDQLMGEFKMTASTAAPTNA